MDFIALGAVARRLAVVMAGGLLAVGLVSAGLVSAQDFPTKPVRYVVPNSPGTLIDLTARIVSTEMTKTLGQPIVVENRPSADAIIGYEAVAKSPADGYTLASALVGELVVLPVIRKDLRFDPVRDLPPVMAIADGRFLFGSAASVPWKSFAEFVATIKASPGKYNYGTSSIVGRLYTEAIIRDLGLNLVHVPYKSGGDYLRGMSTAEFHVGFVGESALINFGEKVRSIAVTGQSRLPTFPDTPTFAELGQLRTRNNTFAMHAPAGLPRPVMDRLVASLTAALAQPDVRAQFSKIKLEVVALGPEASARNMADTARLFSEIARSVGILPQ